jgi:hypothetical protein
MNSFFLFRFLRSTSAFIFRSVGLIALISLCTSCEKQHSVANSQPVGKLVLGSFELLKGNPYLVAAVNDEDTRYPFALSSSSGSVHVRNYLFFNPANLSAHRLVPKNNWLFLQDEKLGQFKNGNLIKVEGLWYAVVTTDTNGDNQLTSQDRMVIAMSDAAGKNYTNVVTQVDRILGTHQKGTSTLQILYTLADKNFVTEVNIRTRQVIRTLELASIQ